MASEVMHGVDICPTEDAVAALLEFLVDPRLPAKSSTCHTPSQSDQEYVAKQIYAVVLLYNFFYRKQHPQLEFLGFESFCKLAVVLRPSLLAYMKFMKISNDTELVDVEKQLSLTEKKIMGACEISMSTVDTSSVQGWPISKVAVFLVDSRRENCFLKFSSITDGVWSLIEKELDSKKNSVDTLGSDNMKKKRRIVRKSFKSEPVVDESTLQHLAFSAVMEATGISQSDLRILDSTVVYSLSKEKAATSFYIMQCTQPNNDNIVFPIKDAIHSLQGSLVKKNSGGWTHASIVEYFHLLPYAGMLLNWLSKERVSLQVQIMGLEIVDKNIFKTTDRHYEAGFLERFHQSHEKDSLIDFHGNKGTSGFSKPNDDNEQFGSNPNACLMKVNDDNGCPVFGVSGNIGMSNMEERSGSSTALTKNEDGGEDIYLKVQPGDLSELNRPTNNDNKAELIDTIMEPVLLPENIGENAADGNSAHNIISLYQDKKLASDHAAVNHESNVDDLDKVQTTKCSKDKGLSEIELRVFLRKRDRLVNDKNGCPAFGVSGNIGMSNVDKTSNSSAALTRNESNGGNINLKFRPSDLSKLNSPTNGDNKVELIDTITEPEHPVNRGEDAAEGNSTHNVISLDQHQKLASDHTAVNHESNIDDLDKAQTTKCSKDKGLSKTVSRVYFRKWDGGGNIDLKVQPSDLSKLNSPTNGDNKAELIDTIMKPVLPENRGENAADGNSTHNNISSDQDKKRTSDHATVNHESNLNDLDKLQTTKCSKDRGLSETVLRVFVRKRDRLSLRQRDIENQIAHCDKLIQAVLKGGDDELMNNIESSIEGCIDGWLTGVAEERVYQGCAGSSQCIKKKRLLDTTLNMQNPCQELDDLCYESNWMLPTYHVSVIEGGFRAKVHVKRTDFECSAEGEGCSHPQQARESAAKKILAVLQKAVQ